MQTYKPVPKPGVLLFLCMLGSMCEGIDLQSAGIAAGGISAAIKPSAGALGTFFSASTLGLFFGALIGGRLSDSFGRKGVLVTSVAVFGLFSVLNGFAWDMSSLTLTRLLTGLGIGGALPNLVALISESTAHNRRDFAVALSYSGLPLGGALISLVSLALSPFQWRWIFIIGGVLPIIVAPVMAIYLNESPKFLESRRLESQRAARMMDVLLEGRGLATLLLWSSFFFGLLTLYLLLNWLPLLLVAVDVSSRGAAMAQIGFNLGGVFSALMIGRLLGSSSRQASIWVTFILLPCLMYALAESPPELDLIILIVFLLGCAVLAGQAFLYTVAPSYYPTRIRGIGVGLAVAVGRTGSFVGPKLGGLWRASGANTSQLLLKLLPIVIVGSVLAIALAYLVAKRPIREL